jgi:hypothetical protein
MYLLRARSYQRAVNSLSMLGQAAVIRGYWIYHRPRSQHSNCPVIRKVPITEFGKIVLLQSPNDTWAVTVQNSYEIIQETKPFDSIYLSAAGNYSDKVAMNFRKLVTYVQRHGDRKSGRRSQWRSGTGRNSNNI